LPSGRTAPPGAVEHMEKERRAFPLERREGRRKLVDRSEKDGASPLRRRGKEVGP